MLKKQLGCKLAVLNVCFVKNGLDVLFYLIMLQWTVLAATPILTTFSFIVNELLNQEAKAQKLIMVPINTGAAHVVVTVVLVKAELQSSEMEINHILLVHLMRTTIQILIATMNLRMK
jgi:hypothetical protein